ncbi:DEAD/DEAH box helicase family protein [Streptococcus equi subsp. ruminatorum]|uniref:DEAD/DEAH box helicase family protein n=1 Tax=Streptococcus equi subsp. ruminatorum TaxID=254358 RepID=A0A6M1KY67_9STRE|nr:DEAD/DEAH box helicase family protein [Streptococcus equi subsp. ruminatorum]
MEIDNRTIRLVDVLREELTAGSRVKIAAATFSMFAYQELKKELESIEELQFIFTSPTFTRDEYEKKYREYTIPKKDREGSIFGRNYELKLMNELNQKTLAKECADWVRRKARFKSIKVHEDMEDGLRIESSRGVVAIDRFKNFDRKELGYEPTLFGSRRQLYREPQSLKYLQDFNDYWENDIYFRQVTDEVLENLNLAYREHSPEFLYYVTIYNIFGDFLEDVSQDHEPNEMVKYKQSKIWQLLYDFQKDAVESLISKLEKYNGCILADSVGLGKTFTALAVMTYYAYRGKRILVLCPKKLENNWNMYRHDYKNNPIYDRYLQYDVLYHTDLSRDKGFSNGIDLSLNCFDTYDLVVIDESHNFRNGGSSQGELDNGRENRYTRLMNRIIKDGVPTKVLMLSATPVNNRFSDLKNQIALAYEGDSSAFDERLDTKTSIDDIFRQAQATYNKWADLPSAERTTERLLDDLDFDFFKVLDSVTIARSRKHIREFYDKKAIGNFPIRLTPKNYYPDLTTSDKAITYQKVYDLLDQLQLTIYQPSRYIFASKLSKYEKIGNGNRKNLTRLGRETGIKKLMMVNLLKRLESSVESFRYTLIDVVKACIVQTVSTIEQYKASGGSISIQEATLDDRDFDLEDSNDDIFVGKKNPIALQDMDYETWLKELKADLVVLNQLEMLINQITPAHDKKLQELKALIDNKMANPINEDNYKVLIFSAFATTTEYLYREISQYVLEKYGRHTAQITGSDGYKTTLNIKNSDLNTLLTFFSPQSKSKAVLYPDDNREIDILIATDVISEGQNLQDCDTVVNFDIHWNPVRIIQRFGRVDRIGSQNNHIQLVNFWPNIALDDYINLKARVESRMKISVLTSTADDNILTDEEEADNNYRQKQLQRLKEEVVDLEDMSDGISITDLGLEDYRRNLLHYLKNHPELEKMPKGLQAVVEPASGKPEGAIFVLKQIVSSQTKQEKNRLYPYIIVYVDDSGEAVYQMSDTKGVLDYIRMITKGKSIPDQALVTRYNQTTKDGADMLHYSMLLQKAIDLLIEDSSQSTMDALFNGGAVNLFESGAEGKDDFELICFFALLRGA